MPNSEFQVTFVDAAGSIVQNRLYADSSADALRLSRTTERSLISIRKQGFQWSFRSKAALTPAHHLSFCEGLLQLLQSGFNLNESLEILSRQQHGVTQRVSKLLLTRLYLGESPSAAFANSNVQWPELLISLLRAGETNGELAQCLARFCELERRSVAVKKKLIAASIYPLTMLFFSAIVMTFLLIYVVPKFAALIDDPNRTIPWASQVVFMVSRQLSEHGLFLGLVVVAIAIGGFAALRITRFKRQLLNVADHLPLIGPLLVLVERSRLNRVIAALVNGAMPISAAIDKATIGSSARATKQLQQAREMIVQGQSPSLALFQYGLINDIESQLLRSAERGGQLGSMLDRIASIQEDSISARVDKLAAFYSPVLLFIVALVVGVVVIALYWPLLDVFESVR